MQDRFAQIYAANEWGGGSGPGSFPVHTRGYVKFLERFIRRHRIGSVVDLGCGDWQFSRNVDWGTARYDGFDIVPSVIEQNNARFKKDAVTFSLFDGDFASLPTADLLLAKDVLQHWSNDAIASFLPTLGNYRYALITNCVNPAGETLNTDIVDGDFHYLDLRLPPFHLEAERVYSFTNAEKTWWRPLTKPQWRKMVLLVRSAPGDGNGAGTNSVQRVAK